MAFKRRGPGALRWVSVEVISTPWEAYKQIVVSSVFVRLLSSGYREYGIQGLSEMTP